MIDSHPLRLHQCDHCSYISHDNIYSCHNLVPHKGPQKQVQQKGYNIDVVGKGDHVNIPVTNYLADHFH